MEKWKDVCDMLDKDLKKWIPNMWGALIENIHREGGLESYLFSVPQENDTAHMGFKVVDEGIEYGIKIKFYKKEVTDGKNS